MVEKIRFCVPSSDGVHELKGVVYLPDCETRGFFQVVHGMTEHIARYDRFLSDMAADGWICFGYDHLGHGNTARNASELGYIAKKKGWELLAKDVKVYSDAVRSQFGNMKMPFCLMGHSMGSFVARLAAQRFVSPDRLVVMGTGGPNPAADPGLALIDLIKLFKGDKHISKLVEKVAFGSYNDRFGKADTEDSKLWLTNDAAVRKEYYADPFCSFSFTLSAMGDLIRLIKYTNSKKWYRNIPDSLPILLVSGGDDPVGNYGKGVNEVAERLRKQGKKVSCIIYKGARHEILNDFTYESVKKDIVRFLQKPNLSELL